MTPARVKEITVPASRDFAKLKISLRSTDDGIQKTDDGGQKDSAEAGS